MAAVLQIVTNPWFCYIEQSSGLGGVVGHGRRIENKGRQHGEDEGRYCLNVD